MCRPINRLHKINDGCMLQNGELNGSISCGLDDLWSDWVRSVLNLKNQPSTGSGREFYELNFVFRIAFPDIYNLAVRARKRFPHRSSLIKFGNRIKSGMISTLTTRRSVSYFPSPAAEPLIPVSYQCCCKPELSCSTVSGTVTLLFETRWNNYEYN